MFDPKKYEHLWYVEWHFGNLFGPLIEKRVFYSREERDHFIFTHKIRWWEKLPFVIRIFYAD